jgi:Raf kinase inhibitor-like YbhB/YbcL family protein
MAAVAAVAMALAACGDDGRTLTEPDPSQTTTTRATGAGAASGQSGSTAAYMQMTSPDFTEGGAIPTVYTCFGDDISPALALTNVPTGTAEVAIVVRDVDADGFIHWVISNIPAQGGGVTQGSIPEGAIEATNGFGTVGWRGPCPPSGTHHYMIQAYALTAPSGLTQGMPGDKAASIIESAEQTGVAAISITAAAQSAG